LTSSSMPHIMTFKCPNCGASLDPAKKNVSSVCEFCGTPFIIEDKNVQPRPQSDGERGYQLFWDGKQTGHDPNWTYEQAVGNLRWNRQVHPEKQVSGTYNGDEIEPEERLTQYIPPQRVAVLPCFFVPRGASRPDEARIDALARHLDWARTRYAELLPGRATFALAAESVQVIESPYDIEFFRHAKDAGLAQIGAEILHHLGYNRYTCPYICFTVFQNDDNDFPTGRGSVFNGGYNTGGGLVLVSSYALTHIANFQSTVQHELAHAFGLPHSSVYGYDMKTDASIMSYNLAHHTRGFEPSRTPGVFTPEDLRGLALNKRGFGELDFSAERDVPLGYTLYPEIVPLPPMTLHGQPGRIEVRTPSGEDYSSRAGNIVQNIIRPSVDSGSVSYDSESMWHSAKTPTGWVSLELDFPVRVALTAVRIHSQHSGKFHAAVAMKLWRWKAGGYERVVESKLNTVDEKIGFAYTEAQRWKLELKAGASGYVVVRGLQFFSGSEEIIPPLIPVV